MVNQPTLCRGRPRLKTEKVRTAICIDRELWKALRAKADREYRTISGAVEAALAVYLAQGGS